MDLWKDILGSPKYIVAPMVDASELAWRLLSRKYGAQLCYTPMLHSAIFCKDVKYRKESLVTCEEDKPLIVQFCGNDPKVMLEAALFAQDYCCAIDVNLGCPQAIAKKGHYGAFLQDEWDLIEEIVSTLSKNLKVPVTCKIRRFDDLEKTIRYAQMLERAGCKMLTLHGRTREQKGALTGLADWSYVTEVRKVLKIPIISNGNIQCKQDADRCLESTGVESVMTAEGNLFNPYIFASQNPPCWEPSLEYLKLVEAYPCPLSYIRGHLFKLCHHVLCLPENTELRIRLGAANELNQFYSIINEIKEKYFGYHQGDKKWEYEREQDSENLVLPPWLCQSYVRLAPDEHIKLIQMKQKEAEEYSKTVRLIAQENGSKRHYTDENGQPISRKKMKKLRRVIRRPQKGEATKRPTELCNNCANPMGGKCLHKMCKKCCRTYCFLNTFDCPGHKILIKTKRERKSIN